MKVNRLLYHVFLFLFLVMLVNACSAPTIDENQEPVKSKKSKKELVKKTNENNQTSNNEIVDGNNPSTDDGQLWDKMTR